MKRGRVFVLPLALLHFAKAKFFVSPAGLDSNDGLSPDHAFLTLGRAKDAANLEKSPSTCSISLAPGQYELSEAFVLTKDDVVTVRSRLLPRGGGAFGCDTLQSL